MEKYDSKKIEEKWQKYWEKHPELYAVREDFKVPKKYVLDMFPYPSGEGLHVGHVESYTATDIISRYLRMKGNNVLHSQGWDAFGLPAENYAIKTGIHPSETTKKAIATFTGQLNKMGFSYDWSREVNSSDPEYYKWTQWLFLLFYKNGLAYKKKAKVNWCPSCQTVLANEQVVDGECERCGHKVIQKDLEQWFFKITDFIEDKKVPTDVPSRVGTNLITAGLLSGLDKVDWPEPTKAAQKNWIGKSEGATIKFPISNFQFPNKSQNKNIQKFLEVFTTRLDTIYGCTYCVIAPEHPIIQGMKNDISNWNEVDKYIKNSKTKSDLERLEAKDKTGVEIKGIKVVNPFNNEEVPLYVADYVLYYYGTGAVMAVPAHDERDYVFAKKYKLEIREVIKSMNGKSSVGKEPYIDDGKLVSSEKYTGLTSEEARERMVEWLEKNKYGEGKVNYKLRDWLISRQRYWGAPIPIIYCRRCWEVQSSKFKVKSSDENFQTTVIDGKEYAIISVPENELPVSLPEDVDFKPTGESPLKYSKEFHDISCPVCGSKKDVVRESDTMDTFVCSSWYYFRYADPKNKKEFASKDKIEKWLPVDLYLGGAEHSVLHLLYARFFTKVLHNLGYVDFDEPFAKLRHQGIILAEDGRKMSKSLGNVINPDDIVKEFGADSLRLFEMFMGPLEDMKPWNTRGIIGMRRFLEKIHKLSSKLKTQSSNLQPEIQSLFHKTIKKVTDDIENLKFNTAISALMIVTNVLEKEKEISLLHYSSFLLLISPFAPHIAEELWEKLGHKESIFLQKWPEYDPELIKDEEIELVVQINGKLRDRIKASADINEEEAKKLAMESDKIKKFISGREIKKIIFVKGKLVNIVIR